MRPNSSHRTQYIKIAAAAEVDPRTVEAYMRGTKPTTRLAARAIRLALSQLQIPDPRQEMRL